MVRTSDCDSDNAGSTPVLRPLTNPTESDIIHLMVPYPLRLIRDRKGNWLHVGSNPTGTTMKNGRMKHRTKAKCHCSVSKHGTSCCVAREKIQNELGRSKEKIQWKREIE